MAPHAACAADKYVVCARPAVIWQQFTRKRAKTALHPVSDHSAANFLRNGNAKPLDRLPVSPVMNQQDESGHCHAATLVCGKKIRALTDDADSAVFFLRGRGMGLADRESTSLNTSH